MKVLAMLHWLQDLKSAAENTAAGRDAFLRTTTKERPLDTLVEGDTGFLRARDGSDAGLDAGFDAAGFSAQHLHGRVRVLPSLESQHLQRLRMLSTLNPTPYVSHTNNCNEVG